MTKITNEKIQQAANSLQIKIGFLWASLMSCYIYCDHFGLYVKGAVSKMNDGLIGPLGVATPEILVGVSALMAIPAIMISLSVILKAKLAAVINIIIAVAYIIIQSLTIPGSENFYIFFSVIEISILLVIIWFAIKLFRAAPNNSIASLQE